ncbi:MAG TPA: hypothetical protein VFN19_00545, partial [Candidatus Nanopelagicales bacterium]|nr:hypothetical protein [Candidatus Nanopelagicales bacterium]
GPRTHDLLEHLMPATPSGTEDPTPDSNAAELAALREEVERLRSAGTGRRRPAGRAVAATVVLVVASLLLPLGLVAYWGQRTLLDTERYVSTVAPLSQDPTIRTAVGEVLSTQLNARLDLQTRIGELLPPKAAPLAAPIAGGVESFLDQQIQNFLASDRFSELWAGLNQRAQQALVRVLTADPDGAITLQGSQVVLDTGVIAEQIRADLVARGLTIIANVPIPPQADREIVLLDAPALAELRTLYGLSAPVAEWLIFVVAALFVGAVLLYRRRARAVLIVGIVLAAEAVLLRLGLGAGASVFSSQLVGTPFESAGHAFYATLTVYLQLAIRTLFVLGLILVFAGWFSGGSPSSRRSRAWLSGVLNRAGTRTADTPLAAVGAWVAPRRNLLRGLVLLVAAVVVLAQDQLTGAVLLWTLFGVLVAVAVLEFLAGAAPTRVTDAPVVSEDEKQPVRQ